MNVSWIAINASWLSFAGLFWDLAAAAYLGKAFFSSDDSIELRSGTYWNKSPPALRAQVEQRMDARYGIGHLIVRFLLQAMAAAGITVDLALAAFVASPVVLCAVDYLRNFKYKVAWQTLAIGLKEGGVEAVWRRHFSDLSEAEWIRAKRRSQVTFTDT